ncbi:GNAT family N-acetyltransferase [Rhodovibrionaceae bacterium A322]
MITSFTHDQCDAIVEIFYRASLLAHPFLTEEFLQQEKTNIRDIYLPNVETRTYQKNGQVLGFISLLDQEVMALFVEPAQQGQGIGTALMDRAVIERGDLEVVVFNNNPIGRAFYKRYGFTYLNEFEHEPTGQTCLRLRYQAPTDRIAS